MQSAAKKFLDESLEYDELYGQPEEVSPRLVVTRRVSKLAGVSRVRLFLCATMVVAVVSLTIYNNVAMVELGDRVNQQATALTELLEEGEILQSKLDNATSLSEVAEKASSLMLMGKAESYQTTYISLREGDTVQRTTKTPDQLPAQQVIRTIAKLQEYMSNR